jgi:hypothetical protein
MTISQMLLPEFDQEMVNTRKLLERVPDGRLQAPPQIHGTGTACCSCSGIAGLGKGYDSIGGA